MGAKQRLTLSLLVYLRGRYSLRSVHEASYICHIRLCMEALMCVLFIIVRCMQVLFRHMLRTRLSRSVSVGLFNGLCILLSCGRIVVTVATRTQSVSRSDGGDNSIALNVSGDHVN